MFLKACALSVRPQGISWCRSLPSTDGLKSQAFAFPAARAAADVAEREAGASRPHRKTDERLLTSQRADL